MDQDIEKRLLEIQERGSKASMISAISACIGVAVGSIGVIIAILSYNNSIRLQEIATKPIVSLFLNYSNGGEKIQIVNDGNGQALIKDVKIVNEAGIEMSIREESAKDPSQAIFFMQEILGIDEIINESAAGEGAYALSYFVRPFVMRGNSSQSLMTTLENHPELDRKINSALKKLDFKSRLKVEYCYVDESECFTYQR